jgi:hypothetical protein
MSHTGLSASTITTYISGISTMHKLNGHTDNTKSFLVTKRESAIVFEIPEICKALIIILYCKVDKTRCLTRDITLTDFEDFLLIM